MSIDYWDYNQHVLSNTCLEHFIFIYFIHECLSQYILTHLESVWKFFWPLVLLWNLFQAWEYVLILTFPKPQLCVLHQQLLLWPMWSMDMSFNLFLPLNFQLWNIHFGGKFLTCDTLLKLYINESGILDWDHLENEYFHLRLWNCHFSVLHKIKTCSNAKSSKICLCVCASVFVLLVTWSRIQ